MAREAGRGDRRRCPHGHQPAIAETHVARETIEEKADRLLATGHVRVLRAGGERTVVRVEGDHAVYAVTGSEAEPLHCECPAALHHMRCSHLIAAELVTLDP